MQRNIGSEFRVALAAIVLLTIPVIFALLLINQEDREDPDSTASSAEPRITIFTSTPAEVAEAEETDAVTDEPEVVNDETADVTSSPTATATDEPESPTPTATDTVTETPTATPSEGLSVLQVRTPSEPEDEEDEEEATATITPSNTRRATATPSPTGTSTHRPTITEKPSSTLTNTPRSTIASRATEDEFAGILPTPTLPASPTVAVDATRTPASCDLPRGWTTYRVRLGDTLFAIALATNSTVSELRAANCIDDVDNITSEESIYVPRVPRRPVSTQVPSDVRPGLAAFGCLDPRVQILSPGVAARVSGVFTVSGTATREDFGYYKIEVRPDWAEIYNFYLDSYSPVENGSLGVINAELFDDGLHWIRLTVVDERAGIPAGATCEVPLIFE